MFIPRKIDKSLTGLLKSRPALLLTGVRQCGKSILLQQALPQYEYITLDKAIIAQQAQESPAELLDNAGPVLIDEVQYAPNLFRELKVRIDANRQQNGHFVLTGSHRLNLMNSARESLVGRIGILHLETLSVDELRAARFKQKELERLPLQGGYPETWAGNNIELPNFFESYIQTYLEKDLRTILDVRNLQQFRQFLRVCAARATGLLNYTDLASEVGISLNTAKTWLATLEMTGLVYLLPPYYVNIGKRFVKAPKLYFADNGILCHLLNIDSLQSLKWENFVFTELVKQDNSIPGRQLFFYRDSNAVEIDFVRESGKKVELVEVKVSEQVTGKKFNFEKVAPLLKKKTVECAVACTMPEDGIIRLKSYSVYNPLRV